MRRCALRSIICSGKRQPRAIGFLSMPIIQFMGQVTSCSALESTARTSSTIRATSISSCSSNSSAQRFKDGAEPQSFFVRITRELVQLMEERTADGYVFRTDLRLRPDAGATQIALSTDAAAIYYESFGQNWERAALIKARAVAGDIEAGELFLEEIAPFIWRRNLDFAAIADIHAMKRQIHAFRGFGGIGLPGHNIKLGPGGIREIEFFVQTQQLIAGGRQRHLRVRAHARCARGPHGKRVDQTPGGGGLAEAYVYLRRIEHRLQMVADEQTHEIPEDHADIERVAYLSGYDGSVEFADVLLPVLASVQGYYSTSVRGHA